MTEATYIEEINRGKTPTELNDGLDPEEEQQCYQGKSTTKDGIYIGTYSFFIWLGLIIASILFIIWQIVPRKLAYSLGLEPFFTLMPDQYWTLVIPAGFVMGFFCIIIGYYGVMEFFVVDPRSPYAYTDERKTEVTKGEGENNKGEENIPPIEDCEVNKVSEMIYS
ncbi:hypothetical protein ENUP19_0202G0001 [Entamoeba nuttalli]|uniref:PIG-P protein n=2 Tax=Entamoeba nuttalli TaxID=412467 RepID=K2GGH8_ENTNP|nr:PIG-P protein [Entamoeba nuttalli P19]EKE41871.1 PIG-P protein [Entamoeba nuttalli P19]|eukprot:XP_008855793.1 PIG-P protein [Entamoeba nuttalli P19]